MKRTVRFLLLAACLPVCLHAASISVGEAEHIAMEFLDTSELTLERQDTAFCIFQRKDSAGFVIVSLHENPGRRILGFSKTNGWDERSLPPQLAEWLERIGNSGDTCAVAPRRVAASVSKQSVEPLLTCHWHQSSPYNDLSPVITDGNIKTVAGCVAIAAAQIVYFWRDYNPDSTLRNTPTYIYGGAPVTEVIPKGSPNHWELMRDDYTSVTDSASRAAVAQLCYVVGTTSYLNFASSTSGSIRDAANAISSQYQLLSSYASKAKYTQEEWTDLLYGEVAQGRPVLCSGTGSGGHAFVLDGYDSETDLYHFNFGWGGYGDGYYPVNGSAEDMGGYSENQAVAYNIHPKSMDIDGITTPQTVVRRERPIIYNMTGMPVTHLEGHGIFILDYGTERQKIFVP